MTIGEARQHASAHIDPFDADILLAFLLKKDRAYLIAHGDESLSFSQKLHFMSLVRRRKKGIPVAYLTGTKEFYGLEFLVNKHTLVPRPETELLVEQTLHIIARDDEDTLESHNQPCILIDVGTGSGCIPIAIQKNIPEQIQTFAVDISEGALETAKLNAQTHNARIKFFCGSLLDPLQENNSIPSNSHLVITANLPYLTDKQFNEEPSIQHEPKSALVAPNKGLLFYEVLTRQIAELIAEKKCTVTALYEIDPAQAGPLKAIVEEELPQASIIVHKDYATNDRIFVFSIET